MKNALFLVVALVAVMLVAAPSFAEDGKVSADGLAALGLGGLQEMSDAEGTQVRGRSTGNGTAMVIGTSLISFQFVTPDTKNFVTGSSINMVQGNLTDGGAGDLITKLHGVSAGLNFAVADGIDAGTGLPNVIFSGSILGNIGGSGGIAFGPLSLLQ